MKYGSGIVLAIVMAALLGEGCGDRVKAPATSDSTTTTAPAESVRAGRSPTGTNAPPRDERISTIVPGESLGPIRIGERLDSVARIFGRADSSHAAMGHVWEFRTFSDTSGGFAARPYELDVYGVRDTTENLVVKQVRVTSPRYRTASGISTESTLADIRKAYPGIRVVETTHAPGHDDAIDVYDLKTEGIAFEVQRGTGDPVSASCVAIIVHPHGSGVNEEYLKRIED